MDRSTYLEYLNTEVCKGIQNPFIRFLNAHLEPAVNAVYIFRKMQYLRSKKGYLNKLRVKMLQLKLAQKYGILASPDAVIGKGLRFVHPTSIVIGMHVVAGDNLSLYQNTTLGGGRKGDVNKGNQPVLGDNVTIFANSLVLGKICIGNNVIVGANSLLLESVPDGSVCVGSPAKVIKNNSL